MSWKDIGKAVAEYAPLLGGVIGGPAGAGIGGLVASALGVEDNEESIMKAVKSDPQAAVKLRKIETDHESRLQSIKLESFQAELTDRQNARSENKHSIMPAVIVSVLTVGLIAFIAALMFVDIPTENLGMLRLVFGQYLTAWIGSIYFWTGTTRGSAEKSKRMGV